MGDVLGRYDDCICPTHIWGELGAHGDDEFLEVFPGVTRIVRHGYFLHRRRPKNISCLMIHLIRERRT